MRIMDWSADVCSSDLRVDQIEAAEAEQADDRRGDHDDPFPRDHTFGVGVGDPRPGRHAEEQQERESVVLGKSVSVRVDLSGRRIIKNTTRLNLNCYFSYTKPHDHFDLNQLSPK